MTLPVVSGGIQSPPPGRKVMKNIQTGEFPVGKKRLLPVLSNPDGHRGEVEGEKTGEKSGEKNLHRWEKALTFVLGFGRPCP